jgi:hypothetical protein
MTTSYSDDDVKVVVSYVKNWLTASPGSVTSTDVARGTSLPAETVLTIGRHLEEDEKVEGYEVEGENGAVFIFTTVGPWVDDVYQVF